MKINRVQIYDYGKWHHKTFQVRPGLEIWYGRNEAGKTTLLSFIRGVLFGYLPRRTSHKNYIPRQAKNYGGQLEVTIANRRYLLERTSGKHGGQLKFSTVDGRQLPVTRFRQLMGPIDRTTFDALFYFGNVDLTQVTKLKKQSLIQRIQKVGMANSQFWLTLSQQLVKHAKVVYSPRGYRPQLNQALKKYARLEQRVQAAKQRYPEYLTLVRKIHSSQQQQRLLRDGLARLNKRAGQLSQQQEHGVQIQQLRRLRQKARAKARTGFTDDDRNQLKQLRQIVRDRHDHVEVMTRRLRDTRANQADHHATSLYLNHRSLVRSLSNQFKTADTDLRQQALLQHDLQEIRSNLKKVRSHCVVRGKIESPLSAHEVTLVHELRKRFDQLRKRVSNLRAQRLKAAAAVHTPADRNTIFRVRKWVPGVGLLVLNLSLIRTRQLKKHGDYHKIKVLYRQPKRLQQRLERDRAKLADLKLRGAELARLHHYPTTRTSFDHWLSIQDELRRFQFLNERNRKLTQQLCTLTSWLKQYFQQWRFLKTDVPMNVSGLRKLRTWVRHNQHLVKAQQALKKRLSDLRAHLKTARKQFKRNRQQLKRFYQCRHVKNEAGFIQQYQAQLEIKKAQRKNRHLTKQLTSQQLVAVDQADLKSIAERVNRVNRRLQDHNQRLQTVLGHQTAQWTRLQQLVRDGSYGRLTQRLANARTGIDELARKWLVERLTSEWIDRALALANHNRVPRIERQVQANFRVLTNHHYRNVLFNKTRLSVQSRQGRHFTLPELSKGTLQQLYLALIFAFAKVLGKKYPLPILIDDGFTDFDIQRRRAAWRLLKRLSGQLQVIYCTSDNQVSRDYQVDKL